MPKEIWFRCDRCSEEAYCDVSFLQRPEAEVMCPFCHHRMKLKEVRIT